MLFFLEILIVTDKVFGTYIKDDCVVNCSDSWLRLHSYLVVAKIELSGFGISMSVFPVRHNVWICYGEDFVYIFDDERWNNCISDTIAAVFLVISYLFATVSFCGPLNTKY